MTAEFPHFRYHPDPLATGSVRRSDAACACCGRNRGFIYAGPVYAEAELDSALCPWCIADGSAHRDFGAEFTDRSGVGDGGRWEHVPETVVGEIATRTPGFCGWQQERWFTCCGDGAVFLGRVGHAELVAAGADAVRAIQDDCALDGDQWAKFFESLDRDGSPTAYLFRCSKCNRLGGYTDCH